jgi:hypothetical protein
MPVLAGQWARQSVNLPLRIRLFTTHKLTKSRFPSRVLCPSDHPSRETNHDSPFRTSQGVLKGCRARPCARAAERARACRRAPGSAMSAVHGVPPWPAQVAGGAAVGQAGQLPSSAAPGLTRTPISQQSLQQLANQCAGFSPPPGTPRVGVRQQQRCYLQPHVVQGLCTLSVMLGADRTTALSDFRPGRDHTQGDQVLRRASVRAWHMSTACSWVTCSWLTDMS